MKKFLLSSIIMLGVCGIASAQTDSKVSKKQQTSAIAPAITPQKAAIMPASDAAVSATSATSDDKNAAAPLGDKQARVAKSQETTTVDAAGVVVPSNDAKRKEEKMAAAKAANAPKTGKQQK